MNIFKCAITAIVSLTGTMVSALAVPAVVYQDETMKMGYLQGDDAVSRLGYSQCTTSIGDYLYVRSGNVTNIHPSLSIDVGASEIRIRKNRHVIGERGAYICHNDAAIKRPVTTGYVRSGTNIGAGLQCVLTVGNFMKPRYGCSGCGGSVSCSYDSATGVITASQTERGRISECGYVCVDPKGVAQSSQRHRLVSRRYGDTSGSDIISAGLSVAIGTNSFFSECSNTIVTGASYDPTTGAVVRGARHHCGYMSFSYVAAVATQCSDGVDNDNDGVKDSDDPGCGSPDDNDESDGITQCQDQIDNDRDGATDMADFSCSSPQDNDEANPKAQCQNASDDDSDGLIDLNDPGCSGAQDNNESDGATQCQDTIDNDGDGATDMADFSCSSPQDNDEANPKAQCQNGADDDFDGSTDLADPGCSSAQDNSEADAISQCQDGNDNDGDGLVDMIDPGCSTTQDNNEADEASTFTVGVECITKNADNTTTAYFSYNNTASSEVSFATNSDRSTVNEFVQTSSTLLGQETFPPTRFKSGLNKGTIAVTYQGSTLAWSVRAPGSAASLAIASETSVVCAAVKLQAECRGYSQGVLKARLGYRNDNPFALQAGVGTNNFFSPGAQDRGQPTKFFAGLNKSVFEVALASDSETVSWSLNGQRVVIDRGLPVCDGACVDTPTGAITGQLDDVAQQLSKLMNRAAAILASARATRGAQDLQARRNRQDAERAKQKSALYERRVQEITVGIPAVVKTCPEAPAFCQTVDRQSSIEELKGLYANQVNSIKRVIARAYFRNTGSTKRGDSLVRQAKDLEQKGLAALAKIPRFETQCK